MHWLDSVHSEVNEQFVSNPYPSLNETLTIRLRFLKNDEVKQVLLRSVVDGSHLFQPMHLETMTEHFAYYAIEVTLRQKWLNYHFVLETPQAFYFYNRKGITKYHPTEDHDFVILSDFENPDWVPKSVFYQIFPDRFFQGDPQHAVQNDEYVFDGKPTIQMEWEQPPLSYQDGHCLDFYGGDLAGIAQKIPYFQELGVNAIYVNPIFDAKTTHRYDCTDYFHVDLHLGGDEALTDLTQQLHQHDMKLLVDVSINHTGIEHVWFKAAMQDPQSKEREYYYFDEEGQYIGWHGIHTLPQLNYSIPSLRDVIYRHEDSLVRHFLKAPFHIDGWRFDVGHQTARRHAHQFGHEVFQGIRESVKSVRKDAYIIGEHWEDNIAYHLGDQWDGAMNYFASGSPLRAFAGENDKRLYQISGSWMQPTPPTGVELKERLMQHFGRLPNQLAFLQFNLLDSHDVHRFHNHESLFDFNLYQGMVAISFLLPGAFSIYYGDEVGLDGYIPEEEGCRYPMQWDRSKWDMRFFELYRTMAHLKLKEPALHTGSYKVLYADDETFVLARFDTHTGFLGVLSRNAIPKAIQLPVRLLGAKDDQTASDVFSGDTFEVKEGWLTCPLAVNESRLIRLMVEE